MSLRQVRIFPAVPYSLPPELFLLCSVASQPSPSGPSAVLYQLPSPGRTFSLHPRGLAQWMVVSGVVGDGDSSPIILKLDPDDSPHHGKRAGHSCPDRRREERKGHGKRVQGMRERFRSKNQAAGGQGGFL